MSKSSFTYKNKEDGAEKKKSLKNQVVAAARFNVPIFVIWLAIIFEWLLSLVRSLGDLLLGEKSNKRN